MKYLEVQKNRRGKTRRKQSFFAGIELITKVSATDLTTKQKTQNGMSYGYRGATPKGVIVNVHIREELDGKDRKLFFISTF